MRAVIEEGFNLYYLSRRAAAQRLASFYVRQYGQTLSEAEGLISRFSDLELKKALVDDNVLKYVSDDKEILFDTEVGRISNPKNTSYSQIMGDRREKSLDNEEEMDDEEYWAHRHWSFHKQSFYNRKRDLVCPLARPRNAN
jgi:hypothetical protein